MGSAGLRSGTGRKKEIYRADSSLRSIASKSTSPVDSCVPLRSARNVLPEFQGGESCHRGKDRKNPEPHDDLVVGDAQHFEMMMDRGAERAVVPECKVAPQLIPDTSALENECGTKVTTAPSSTITFPPFSTIL